MKRFLLFSWHPHESWGGWRDFVGSYDELSEAHAAITLLVAESWHIVDSDIGVIILEA